MTRILKHGFRCSRCEFVVGKLKLFQKHLSDAHGVTDIEKEYVDWKHGGVKPTCKCTCGTPTQFYGWNTGFVEFVKGHNASFHSYMSEEDAAKMSEIRARGMREHGPLGWSRGLTQETSDALARAKATRNATLRKQREAGIVHEPWSKGLTKETDGRIKRQGEMLSMMHRTGQITAWHKGRTKNTDPRLAEMGKSISKTLQDATLKARLTKLKKLDNEEIAERLKRNAPSFELVAGLEDYKNIGTENLTFKCKICGTEQRRSFFSIMTNRCYTCDPSGSTQQVEIERFVNSLGFKTVPCDREMIAPYEIDVYVPTEKIGIEMNGVFFHSELYKDKDYHTRKTLLAAEHGIRLIHIFDDEWKEKRELCESMIRNMLNMPHRTIDTKDLGFVKIDSTTRTQFFDENCLEDDVNASISFGAYLDNELVAATSIRLPQISETDNMAEIVRFCTKKNTTIKEWLKKMLMTAKEDQDIKKTNGFVAYVDERLENNKELEQSGFVIVRYDQPTQWWTDGSTRIDRFKVRADSERGMTEQDVADELGVFKVWGCRNRVYELRF